VDLVTVSLIVAHDLDGVIGRGGALPWHLPDDLARFRALTLGARVLMGRRTYESLGRALPDRRNLVLSRDWSFRPRDAWVVRDLPYEVENVDLGEPLVIIGGAAVYAAALPFCTRAHITRVDTRTAGERLTHFPCDLSAWRTDPASMAHHDRDARHAHAFTTMTLERP